jgi:hypothetical protein
MFILERYFASKLYAPGHNTFNNAYPKKEVPNKATIHLLATKFKKCLSVMCSSSDKVAEITAITISSSASATTGYS